MHAFNPLTWFRWMGEFIRCWFLGIPWRDAPKAIPAVILSMVLFTTAFIAFSGGAGWRNRLLDRQLQVSLEREDFPTAEIVIRRQLEADPKNVELIHRFALVREAQSFEEEAKALMRQLMTRRHLPAAKWLLENEIIGKKLTDFSSEELDEVGRVLQLITEREDKNLGAKRMYAEYLIFEQRLSSAIPVVLELAEVEPMRGLQAASLARHLNESEAAEQYASAALERVEEMHKDDPTNSQIAMSIARNQIFLERHSDAIRTLKRSIDVAKTQEERRMLTQALGDAIVAYVTYIEKSPTNTVQERLRVLTMLDAAVKIAPNNPRVVTMVADHVLASLSEDDEQISTVREALISGSPAGIAHFIKGTTALMNEDLAMAELHLEKAAEQMPRSAAILNNLAVALAMKQEPDYEKALQVANAAIDNVPSPTPHFYETRGQILFRMGRFREAISDLERALPAPDLELRAHQMLADCYDKVGDTDLARGHRETAETMTNAEQSPTDVLETKREDAPARD
ncbi:Tetratricopeptide repeat protein [Stieleria neptunia]|uniref:Tetratricopeptide repeat protein n=1 Tax=Stieleria neptunia TaxID=2527979 RepID=A0A518HR16_9BACT|nr:tetratricopeptide repeat protein [Stieleria neptunia]QDV43302.1 Tetratricopeptide repeat protein [Stieleria neptunia]